MPEHQRGEENQIISDEEYFTAVDGLQGQCACGYVFHYIAFEGEIECEDCGRVYNVYVDFEEWDDA